MWMWHGAVVSTLGCHSGGPKFRFQASTKALGNVGTDVPYILPTLEFELLLIPNNGKHP